MEGWRHRSAERLRVGIGSDRADIGVTFQAREADLMPGEHARVDGVVRVMAGDAATETDGRVLEDEWPAKVAVAAETTWLIGAECSHGVSSLRTLGEHPAVRVVAVRARHRVLAEFVAERPIELRPVIRVTGGAIERGLLRWSVDGMTGGTAHRTARVTTLNTSGVGRLVEMTSKTDFVGARGRLLRRLNNVLGIGRFRMN